LVRALGALPRTLDGLITASAVAYAKSEPLLDERPPLVAVRAAPEHLLGPIVTDRAHVGIRIEHCATGHLDEAEFPLGKLAKGLEGLPHVEMDDEDLGVRLDGAQKQSVGLIGATSGSQASSESQARTPITRVLADEAFAEDLHSLGLCAGFVECRKGIEGEVGPLRLGFDGLLENVDGTKGVALGDDCGETQTCREDPLIEGEGLSIEVFRRRRISSAGGGVGLLGPEEGQSQGVVAPSQTRETLAFFGGLFPQPLVLEESLVPHDGVDVPGVGLHGIIEGALGAVEEAGTAVVLADTGEDEGSFGAVQVRSREERLMDLYGLLGLPRLPKKPAEEYLHIERFREVSGHFREGTEGWQGATGREVIEAVSPVDGAAEP
jgi:hypothetical protein